MRPPSRPVDLSRRHFLTLSASAAAAGGALAGQGDAHGAAAVGAAGGRSWSPRPGRPRRSASIPPIPR